MPLNPKLAREQWVRYAYARDMGHRSFIAKANRCEDFFAGMQWDPQVVAELRAVKRPALTINKVLITLSSIFGEQIDTRSEISYRPRYGAPPENADILTKVARFTSDQNKLQWVRSEVFADGAITSRGYYDARLKFERNSAGEVWVSRVNPKAVLPDPDASDYDPETWNDVIVTSWVTPDDIEIMYNKHDADQLRVRGESVWSLGYDSIDTVTDRFAGQSTAYMDLTDEMKATMRSVRVIDRQHRKLTRIKVFVDPKSGDKMPIPDQWGEDEIRHAVNVGGLVVSKELVKRIRWTVTCEDFVLHDDWSPFRRFTIIPYFPHFRYGRTIGLVEGLLDPQELLNKTLSQELHIVNSMANSGWIMRTGSVVNMTPDELEANGAKTGLVIELGGQGSVDDQIQKIQPNQIPTGLDRLSFKAETYIKSVSGRGDNQLGLTRPDQSGKLAEEANKSSDVSLRKALDNLERTDAMLGEFLLELFQNFYTDHRIMNITRDNLTGEMEEISVNLPDLASGEILNDLSVGSYDVVVTSQLARRTLEESEFANAQALKELGIAIPDRFMIENSNLRKKGEIIKAMEKEAASPEAQLDREVVRLGKQMQVNELKAKTANLEADATHKRAKAAKEVAETQQIQQGDMGEQAKAEAEIAKAEVDMQVEREKMSLEEEKHQMELRHEEELFKQKLRLQEEEAKEKRRAMRIQAAATAVATARAAKQPGAKPAGGAPAQQGASA